LGLILASCGDSSISKNEQIFYDKAEQAQALNDATLKAIEFADTDVARSIWQLERICPLAEIFMDSKYDKDGWEFPGDFPEEFQPYEIALTASIIACDLATNLKEKSWATYARNASFFFQYQKCLDRLIFSDIEICPPNGLLSDT
jgi:hypothetical protein